MRISNIIVYLLSVASLPLAALRSQIIIVDSGASGNQVNLSGTYTQNFDSLLSTTPPGGASWVNNVTLPGWYSSQNSYFSNGVNGGLASYGNDSDRALGSVAAAWSLRLVNNSSQTVTGFDITYTGEQWSRGANNPQNTDRIFFDYIKYSSTSSTQVEIANINGAGRTFVPDLYFFAPNDSTNTSSHLDGNLPGNSYNVSFFITGIFLAPGEKLWFSWSTGDTLNFNDHATAIDDLSISFVTTAIPEPASAATLAGLGMLALCALRRRHRS